MNKLITYLKRGQGRGLRPMLIFSALIGILLWSVSYTFIIKIANSTTFNEFIQQLPTIVIQNGVVVDPINVDTAYTVKGRPFFYLQTDREEVSPFSDDGIYLTRKMFAFVSDGAIQQGSFLSGNMTITQKTLKDFAHSVGIWTSITIGIIYFTILWIVYFTVLGVSALITCICRFKLNKGTVWRCTSFAVIAIILIDILTNLILGFFGRVLQFGILFQWVSCILLVLLITAGIRGKKELSNQNIKEK